MRDDADISWYRAYKRDSVLRATDLTKKHKRQIAPRYEDWRRHTRPHASKPREGGLRLPYRANLSQQYSAASFATLLLLSRLHSPELRCSFVLKGCTILLWPWTRNLETTTTYEGEKPTSCSSCFMPATNWKEGSVGPTAYLRVAKIQRLFLPGM
jgi:hypothetical protein